ncbi:MAG TPA: hypothetical protein VGB93_00925 [Methylovirgula sp.]
MNVARLLRRTARRLASWKKADRASTRADLGDLEEQIRIMPDAEFAEYLRLHTKSHRWKV